MKFASWNINSINLRKETVLNWIIENSIDVLGLQEIKCENEKFPTDFFHEKGYFTKVIGQKRILFILPPRAAEFSSFFICLHKKCKIRVPKKEQ